MNAKEFSDLTKIASLSVSSLGEPQIIIAPNPLRIYYEGAHSAGVVRSRYEIDGLQHPIALHYKRLEACILAFDNDEELNISVQKNYLFIEGNTTKTRLNIGESYIPDLRRLKTGWSVILDSAELLTALSFLAKIASNKGVAPILSGVNISFTNDTLVMIATDGFSAVRVEVEVKETEGDGGDLAGTIPAVDLQAALSMASGNVRLRLSAEERRLEVSGDNFFARLALLSGKYPELHLKEVGSASVALSSKSIVSATRAAKALDADGVLSIICEKGSAYLSVKGEDIGELEVFAGDSQEDDIYSFGANYFEYATMLGDKIEVAFSMEQKLAKLTGTRKSKWEYWLPLVVRSSIVRS